MARRVVWPALLLAASCAGEPFAAKGDGGAGHAGQGGSGATGGSGLGGSGVTGGGGSGNAGSGGAPTFDPPWWSLESSKRFRIEVKDQAKAELPKGFQVGLGVQAADIDGAAAPWAGWRIARWSGGSWTEVSRVVEAVAGKQWIWFRTLAAVAPGALDTSYWLYADDPTAKAPPFAAEVFESHAFFDQWDAASWAKTGNASGNGQSIVLDGSGSGASIRQTSKQWGPGYAMDFELTVVAPLVSAGQWFCGGFQRQTDFTNTRPWLLWISRAPTLIDVEAYDDGSFSWKGGNVPVEKAKSHVYGVERFPAKVVYRQDHAVVDTATLSSAFALPLQMRFSAYNGSKITVRFARIRRAIDPEPTVQLGASQTR